MQKIQSLLFWYTNILQFLKDKEFIFIVLAMLLLNLLAILHTHTGICEPIKGNVKVPGVSDILKNNLLRNNHIAYLNFGY